MNEKQRVGRNLIATRAARVLVLLLSAGCYDDANGTDDAVDASVGQQLALADGWDNDGTDMWNQNPGNVGIGTTTPRAPLSVVSTTSGVRTNYWADLNSSVCGLLSLGQNVYLNQADNQPRYSNSHPNIGGSMIQMGLCDPAHMNDIVFSRAAGTTGAIPTTAGELAPMVETMRIASDGNVSMAGSLAANGGIAFPAAQRSSSNPTTLDDYQEGSWQPTLIGGGGGAATYHYRQGSYVKIGRMVYVQIYIQVESLANLSGQLFIGTLPFLAQGSTSVFNSMTVSYWSNLNQSTGGTATLTADIAPGTTAIRLFRVPVSSVPQNPLLVQAADINPNTQLIVGGSYIAQD